MAEPVKFTFNNDFDGGKKVRREEELAVFEDRIETTRVEAEAAGIEQGRAQALGEIEAQISSTLEQVAVTARTLFDERAALEQRLRAEASQLALAISSKLAPALVRSNPFGEIDVLVRDCFAVFQDEPKILIRVNDMLVEGMEARLAGLQIAAGFSGDVVVKGDQSLAIGDCRMEWPDGGAERNINEVMEKVEEAVERYLERDGDELAAG